MENFPQARIKNMADDHNIRFKSMYINIDLATTHRHTNSPRARRLPKSLDPHEEFEFSISQVSMKEDVYAPAMEVASADKLFCRGQLLPLQSVSYAGYNAMKLRAHEEGFSPDCSLQLDGIFDLFRSDSRSSSFRSHQSSHWSSGGEKESRDSMSSSRCSNGSYQDSCFNGAERKAPHMISMLKASHPNTRNAGVQLPSAENGCDIGVVDANTDATHAKPHLRSANSRKWSWKGFFTGLRKASKLWGDDGSGDGGSGDVHKRSVFTFKELPGAFGDPVSYRQSVGHDWEWQANTYQFVSNDGISSSKGKLFTGGLRDDVYEEGVVYCLRSGGRQEASFNGDKGKGNAWNAKESWNRCVSRVKKGTRLSNANACKQRQLCAMESNTSNAILMNDWEDKMDVYHGVMKAKSLSSTPLVKSPVRSYRCEYNSNGGYGGGLYSMQGGDNIAISSSSSSSSSMKNKGKKGGFASCPASMRSSPHHSGLLAVGNKPTPDLHIAIQGAIAHCKQSQASNPP